jgi:hypothetical protein
MNIDEAKSNKKLSGVSLKMLKKMADKLGILKSLNSGKSDLNQSYCGKDEK